MKPSAGASANRPAAAPYLERLSVLLAQIPPRPLDQAVEFLLQARAAGSRVYTMGNGGSAATAAHLANDLMKTACVPGVRPLRALALVDNVALLTAWANDSSYEQIFARQVEALAEPGDVLVAISASGNSANIIAGLHAAASHGLRTIGLLGFDGGAARHLVDVAIHVPSQDYGLVEDAHLAVGHALTAAIRQSLQCQPAG